MRTLFTLALFVVVLMFASCAFSHHLAQSASLSEKLIEQSVSPDTGCHQGYASDGTVHFTIDTARIERRADDVNWRILTSNSRPFNELSGYNHLGDGDYFQGKLYVAAERYRSCTDHDNPAVFVFNAETLERESVLQLGTDAEISGVAIRPTERQLWASSFCDPNRLWVYDLDSMKLLRTVKLDPPVAAIQGLAWRNDFFYLAQNNGTIRKMYLDGVSMPVYHTDSVGAHEGLDYSQRELRWLIDEGPSQKRVHYLVPE